MDSPPLLPAGVSGIRGRIAALRSQLSVPTPSHRPDGRKLALFRRGHGHAKFTTTLFLQSTCPSHRCGANWLCFARLSAAEAALAALAASASSGLIPEIGFVSRRPLACPIRHNSFSTRYLSFLALPANWLCLTRLVPKPAVPTALPALVHTCLWAKLALFGAPTPVTDDIVKAEGLGDGLPRPSAADWVCLAQYA
jgi:hypothetical protein